jgi:hypothetical protein
VHDVMHSLTPIELSLSLSFGRGIRPTINRKLILSSNMDITVCRAAILGQYLIWHDMPSISKHAIRLLILYFIHLWNLTNENRCERKAWLAMLAAISLKYILFIPWFATSYSFPALQTSPPRFYDFPYCPDSIPSKCLKISVSTRASTKRTRNCSQTVQRTGGCFHMLETNWRRRKPEVHCE